MSLMLSLLMVVQVLSALAIIVLVLLQQGKGADMGSAFGTGSAGSLFGASGAANFLSRTTKWAAVVFFVTTAGLAYVSHKGAAPTVDTGVMQNYQPQDRSVPQAPGSSVPGASSVPAPAGDASVPSAPAQPAAPAKPDAAVPQAPATPAAPAQPAK
ncbi:preprotein translocase subunit SecG [Bordetella flabilis]|uniref:Protein-export membrane protein SecG n=1 Tax=Bordetella flabilis TaxID=463014 RepID=A0A193GAD3_9BORD|nr:preprotein translocase subunit SecG [Bordetella flabilis]ANN76957.1 preprotein translocase subunit SecG [Bordetella flabilis]